MPKDEGLREIIKRFLIMFWARSGKEWCGQHFTNEDMKDHIGFSLELEEVSDKALSAILKDYVRKDSVGVDGKKLADILNDQIFSYENTDDNGEWCGECLDKSLATRKAEWIKEVER